MPSFRKLLINLIYGRGEELGSRELGVPGVEVREKRGTKAVNAGLCEKLKKKKNNPPKPSSASGILRGLSRWRWDCLLGDGF